MPECKECAEKAKQIDSLKDQIIQNLEKTQGVISAEKYADLVDKARAEALDRVLSVYDAGNNTVQGVAFYLEATLPGVNSSICVRYSLNGKPYKHTVEIDAIEARFSDDRLAMARVIADSVSKAVSAEILNSIGLAVLRYMKP